VLLGLYGDNPLESLELVNDVVFFMLTGFYDWKHSTVASTEECNGLESLELVRQHTLKNNTDV